MVTGVGFAETYYSGLASITGKFNRVDALNIHVHSSAVSKSLWSPAMSLMYIINSSGNRMEPCGNTQAYR